MSQDHFRAPHQSPDAAAEDTLVRRKIQWRIIPTALLVTVSALVTIAEAIHIAIVVVVLPLGVLHAPPQSNPLVADVKTVTDFAAGICGLLAARACWQGRWKISFIWGTTFFIILLVSANGM